MRRPSFALPQEVSSDIAIQDAKEGIKGGKKRRK
jgi:hypothetical protein